MDNATLPVVPLVTLTLIVTFSPRTTSVTLIVIAEGNLAVTLNLVSLFT